MIETGLYLPAEARASERRHRLLAIHDGRIAGILRELVGDAARLERLYHGADLPTEWSSRLQSPGTAAAPWLFWETFERLADDAFLTIAEAGVCQLIASVVLDHLADNQLSDPTEAERLAEALTGRAAEVFRREFPADSGFWEHFRRLTAEHQSALILELQCRAAPEQFTLATLEASSSGKVSPGVLTVAALAVASAQNTVLAPIEDSLKRVAVASQLVDDVQDWRTDLEAHHLTYFLAGLASAEVWTKSQWPPVEEVERWVLAQAGEAACLRRALTALREATEAVYQVYCPSWTAYIHAKRLEAARSLNRVHAQAMTRGLRLDSRVPQARSRPAHPGSPTTDSQVARHEGLGGDPLARELGSQAAAAGKVSAGMGWRALRNRSRTRSVRAACRLGLEALLAAQRPDGSWLDFDLGEAGGSDTWVTAHIGLQLAALRGWREQARLSRALGKAGVFLLSKWRHGWAYNDLAPVDADSTAHAVLFLRAIGAGIPASTRTALTAHQQGDGGFATYLSGRAESMPMNWCRSHPDVTPVVVQALLALGGRAGQSIPVRRGLTKFAADRPVGRPWPAFWWDLRWYTTAAWSHTLLALGSKGTALPWPRDLPLEWAHGSWLDAALLLEVAMNSGRRQLAAQLVALLLSSQLSDGQWPVRPALRQPKPGVERPWEAYASDELYADIHGLYSAATILNRLARYERLTG